MQLTFIAILITTNLFSIAVIVWTISQPEFKEAWSKIAKKITDSIGKSYDDNDLIDCIREYYKIVDKLKNAQTMEDIRATFIEIQVFEYIFVDVVPKSLYDDFCRRISQCHAAEADRVIRGGRPEFEKVRYN